MSCFFDENIYEGVFNIEYILVSNVFSIKELKKSDKWIKCIPLLSSDFDDILREVYNSKEYNSNDRYLFRTYPEGYPEEAIYFFKD